MKKMTKRTKIYLGAVGAVAILVAALCLLIFLPAQGEEEDQSLTEHHDLFLHDPADMARAEIENENGSFVLHFNDEEGLSVGGYETVDVDETAIKNVMNHCNNVVARQLVESNPADLSLYGLDNPAAQVTLYALDGSSFAFSVGSTVAGELGYYILAKEENTVYVVNSNQIEYFLKSAYYFLTKSVIPVSEDEIETIAISGENIDDVILLTAVEEYQDAIGNTYNYELTSEGGVPAQPGIRFKYFSSLLGLNSSQIMLHDATEEDLAATGLADPIKVLTFTAGDVTRTIRVGNFENDHYLVTVDGTNNIYAVAADALPWVDITLADLLCSNSRIPAITELSSFTVEGDGVSYTFQISVNGENDVAISCDGKDLLYSNMKNFYRFMSLSSGEEYVDSYDPNAEEVCVLTFNKTDGTTYQIRFLKAGVRKLYFEVDGTCRFTISQTYVDKILSDAGKVAAGESTTLLLQ